jgi:hypothetical protein
MSGLGRLWEDIEPCPFREIDADREDLPAAGVCGQQELLNLVNAQGVVHRPIPTCVIPDGESAVPAMWRETLAREGPGLSVEPARVDGQGRLQRRGVS